MKQQRNTGFTLIELLTVIAIIAVLTATTAVVLPRVLEKAHLTTLEGTFHGISTAMVAYTGAQNGTYPPSYGFIDWRAREMTAIPADQTTYYHLNPYMSYIKLHNAIDQYDNFGSSYDLNFNGQIDWYEFSPIGTTNITNPAPSFPTIRYTGPGSLPQEEALQLQSEEHPLVYAPVNLSQFKRAQRYWVDTVQDFHARTWDGNAPELASMQFPPPRYDSYVLISAGPREDYCGVVPEIDTGVTNINPAHRYHIQALRTYFLATRDMDQNNVFDYDFRARTQQGEGTHMGEYNGVPFTNELPAFLPNGQLDPLRANLPGPVIYRSAN